jgi:uncharacterized protein YecE (DUF72 family)
MRIRVGTSGYGYKEWKGSFYPEKLSDKKMLGYYATRLETVEINYTFRRIPKTSVCEGWAEKVPDDFAFSLKASQHISHRKRLDDCEEVVGVVAERTGVLGDRLGATLIQLPPYFKKDVDRLRAFLPLVPRDLHPVFEFRHESWFDDEVYDALREHDVPLVVSDSEKLAGHVVPTASRGYLRLRREDYDTAALADWAARVRDQPWESVLVFFKHEEAGAGPRMAEEFRALF